MDLIKLIGPKKYGTKRRLKNNSSLKSPQKKILICLNDFVCSSAFCDSFVNEISILVCFQFEVPYILLLVLRAWLLTTVTRISRLPVIPRKITCSNAGIVQLLAKYCTVEFVKNTQLRLLTNLLAFMMLFKASALWADAFYKSKRPCVCPSVCLSVHF